MEKFLRILFKISYYVAKIITLGLFITFWRVRFFNFSKLKDLDNSILISNHQSFFDPVIICIPLPYIPVFIARQTLLTNSIVRNASKILPQIIFFDRDNFSISSFRRIVNTLRNNTRAVCLFPEGTRSATGTISSFKRGFAVLSNLLKRNVHVFYIKGTQKVLSRGEIIPHLFTSVSIYYLKKISYNINPSILWKEVNNYYRRIERTIGREG